MAARGSARGTRHVTHTTLLIEAMAHGENVSAKHDKAFTRTTH